MPAMMEAIKMVDLKRQYDRFRDEIDMAIQEVLDYTAFINGPSVKAFRDEFASYLDVPHVIPCGNGTDALQVALMALDLQPGDEFEIIGKFEIINPVTEEMEIEERILATGKISNIVNPKFSWIVLDKKELNDKIRIGDIVDFKYQSSLIEKIINGTKNLYYSIVH